MGEELEQTVSFQGDELRGLDVNEPVCQLVFTVTHIWYKIQVIHKHFPPTHLVHSISTGRFLPSAGKILLTTLLLGCVLMCQLTS